MYTTSIYHVLKIVLHSEIPVTVDTILDQRNGEIPGGVNMNRFPSREQKYR